MKRDKTGRPTETLRLSTSTADRMDRTETPKSRVLLLVYHRDGVETATLSPGVGVIVGREPPADVVVHDYNLSRRHARFTLEDGNVVVEDLGSTNGTKARGQPIQRAVMEVGDEVAMGSVTASVHILVGARTTALGLEGHDSFRGVLEAEIKRSRFFERPFALLVVRALRSDDSHVRHWGPRVQELLRPVDRIALYSPDTVEILLPEAATDDASKTAAKIAARVEGAPTLVCGIAAFPGAASNTDELIAVSLDAVHAATAEEPVRIAASDAPRSWIPVRDKVGNDDERGPNTESPAMRAVLLAATRVARSGIPVLLNGETGSGKEVLARLIHENSPRRDKPMICVNCGALPQSLIVDTLFGHERGAFTSAERQHKGVFESAIGGTVFLDEVGELPPEAQAALLRVLEVKKVTRVGSTKEIDVDVRVIAATHRDLEAMCETGKFRSDLMYRLNAATLQIPPLRARREDVGLLASTFLHQANQAYGCHVETISAAALAIIERYAWPGNVRELRNAIDRAVVIAEGRALLPEDLPERIRGAAPARRPGDDEDRASAIPDRPSLAPSRAPGSGGTGTEFGLPAAALLLKGGLRATMDRIERDIILEALRGVDGNAAEAARLLELPLRTLQYKMKTLGITRQYGPG